MSSEELRELAAALGALFELERMAGCSDRYFRQVCTAKINAIRAAGFREMLIAEAENTINDNKEDQ